MKVKVKLTVKNIAVITLNSSNKKTGIICGF
jgi:hypothetical protein